MAERGRREPWDTAQRIHQSYLAAITDAGALAAYALRIGRPCTRRVRGYCRNDNPVVETRGELLQSRLCGVSVNPGRGGSARGSRCLACSLCAHSTAEA